MVKTMTNPKIKFSIFLLLFVLLAYSLFPFSLQESRIISIKGVAAIVGNRETERDRAIQDAQKKAVEQAVGIQLSSETLTQNFKLVYDNIISKSYGYIVGYDVISEGEEGDVYKVEIEARVAVGNIEKDLQAIGLLLERKNMPRVMIMITEQNIVDLDYPEYFSDLSQAETTLIKKFNEKGFYCIDTQTVKDSLDRDQAIKALEGDNRAAQTIGREFGAEVVVLGKAVAAFQGQVRESNFKSSSSNITARAVQVDTGKIVAIDSARNVAAHLSEYTAGDVAIEKAGIKLAESMIKQILDQWTVDTSSYADVQILVSGIRNFNDLNNFKKVLREKIRGIQNIFQRDFSGNTARLDIRIAGNAQNLAQDTQRTKFGYFQAIVTGVSQNKVTVKLIH